jgi:hypothetical protein
MIINGDVSGGVRGVPERELSVLTPGAKDAAESRSVMAPRNDGVEVSAEGRALAMGTALTPERIYDIRQRILQGAYDQTYVVEAVARRILQSGDL